MKKDMMDIYKHKCPVCGKGFYAQSTWAYKTVDKKHGTRYFCTWKCLRYQEAIETGSKVQETLVTA